MKSKYPTIALHGIDGLIFIKKQEILYAIADGNYTTIQLTKNRKVKILRKLKAVSQILSDENFVRIHHSHLINLEHIVQLNHKDVVIINDGSSLAISRNRKRVFIEKFTHL